MLFFIKNKKGCLVNREDWVTTPFLRGMWSKNFKGGLTHGKN